MSLRPVYSSLLFCEEGISDAERIIDLPDDGFRYVVRDMRIYCNPDLDGQAVTIANKLTGATFAFFNWGIAQRDCKIFDGRVVIDGAPGDLPGFIIRKDNTDSDIDVTISGYILTLP